MAYRADAEYLDECQPDLVQLNSDEYRRLAGTIAGALPELDDVGENTRWQGAGREGYDSKLAEATALFHGIRSGLLRAGTALEDYAAALRRAKARFTEAEQCEDQLRSLIAEVVAAAPQTGAFEAAEPLRQWEDLRDTTGFADFWTDPLLLDGDVKNRANTAHDQASEYFGEAERIERRAREQCVEAMRTAREDVPEIAVSAAASKEIVQGTPELSRETAEAERLNAGTELPKIDGTPAVPGGSEVSTLLQSIRTQAAGLHGGNITGWNDAEGILDGNSLRQEWIYDNRSVIDTAARQAGIPASVLAGIAWKEVGGKSMGWDHITDGYRSNMPEWTKLGPLAGDPDNTSFGPMSLQVRRAAETLGYDPGNLSDGQRQEVVNSLEDPKTSVFIAAQHLKDLKEESGFAGADADGMTGEQGRELAARYNGGPLWRGEDAQKYAAEYQETLESAKKAMQEPPS